MKSNFQPVIPAVSTLHSACRVANCLLLVQAGIQFIKNYPAKAGQHHGFVRFAGCVFLLDSGLRRNDGLMDNPV